MAVFRIEKTSNYTVMSNYHFKDKNLSLKAKGLLSFMLSLPDDWNYTIDGLVNICRENETAIKNTLNELKENEYLEIKKVQNEKGRFEYIYNIYEKPQSKKPEVENPGVDNPKVDNQGQLNTNNKILNNQILNNKKERKKEALKKYDDVLLESGLPEKIIQNLKDFIQMRTLIKKPMTNRALELCINDLKRLSNDEETQVKIIEQSIKRNWQGLYPLKEQQNVNNDSTNIFKNLYEEEGNIWREQTY